VLWLQVISLVTAGIGPAGQANMFSRLLRGVRHVDLTGLTNRPLADRLIRE
jgi:hypothetical protein